MMVQNVGVASPGAIGTGVEPVDAQVDFEIDDDQVEED